jgi:hypothetical protein
VARDLAAQIAFDLDLAIDRVAQLLSSSSVRFFTRVFGSMPARTSSFATLEARCRRCT